MAAMIRRILPLYRETWLSALTLNDLRRVLEANVGTGISLFSDKPCYGEVTPYDFRVRKRQSWIKKQSLGCTVYGRYDADRDESHVWVVLEITPHPVLLAAMGLFGIPGLLFFFNGLWALLTTGQPQFLVSSLFPLLLVYGGGLMIFQQQKQRALAFWRYALKLGPVPPPLPGSSR